MILRSLVPVLALAAISAPLDAQMQPIPSELRPATLDSGSIDNPSAQDRVVFTQLVSELQAPWMRLLFSDDCSLPAGSRLELTALWDGGVQYHDAETLAEWGDTSAFFNGDQVVVELIAGPHTVGNRVALTDVEVGLGILAPESICGVDNRTQSTDPRQGRLSSGCTGWLIGRATNTGQDAGMTAGHCTSSSQNQVLELNVPNSTAGGSLVRSAPRDQYPWSVWNNRQLNSGVGSDWSLGMVRRNSNTRLYPTDANGNAFYEIGAVPNGGQIRITGYGTSAIRTLTQVQKTHVGPFAGRTSTALRYATDTTGGNSGSPIIRESSGKAVGVHTHGGCGSSGGYNTGTRIDRSDIQAALGEIFRVPGQVSAFGAGCPGSTRVSWVGNPEVGNQLRIYFQNLGVTFQPATVIVGLSNTTWNGVPLPFDLGFLGASNCDLLVSHDFPFPSNTGLGAALFDMLFPSDNALVGGRVYAQLLYLNPGANAASLGVTPGVEVVIGR